MKNYSKQKVEQYWTDLISKNLVGRKITKVEYISEEEVKDNMWHARPIAIQLDDKEWIIPMIDDEGNDGGSISTNTTDIIPTL